MAKFAVDTSVPADRSIAEIERTVDRYGATEFAYAKRRDAAIVQFAVRNRAVRFEVALPTIDDPDVCQTPSGRARTRAAATKARDQLVRQRWRALALAIKAKLEMVDSGIATFEQEFLANIVMPGGTTFAEVAVPAIEQAYRIGKMPHVAGLIGEAPA